MPVIIYHNPKCSTSRKVLGWLEEKGLRPQVVEYLKTPPDSATLQKILKQMKARPHDILRRKGEAYEALGDAEKLGDAALLARMVAEPVLIERPIVVSGKGAVLCRPPERVWDLLG
ncbi:arsenate reductase [Dongia mobilis]|uniref:Arsenate reductase n=1 Tax=Dongia mobilis TaxID=578943 RepID=A0A4R6WT19_9PROT|nr:arsenate reductase (glutaredoxin) [Dongia mobilis]TDQ86406.1 arsenate reductase [Dongia mobilis]